MKKIILIVAVLISSILLNSCNQGLLDVPQHGSLSVDTYYANASDPQASQLIASIYSQVYTGFLWNGMLNTMSDDATSGFSNVNVTAANNQGNDYFTKLFRINYLCNLIIEKLPSNSDVKKQVIGEAYFWRAWAYSYLIRMWGTPPLVDHVLNSTELTPANGSPDKLWNYVESSLNEAIKLLPEKTALGQQRTIGGRVTKGSAYALLGKVQLVEGHYPAAITTLETVMNSGKYALIPNFRDLYHRAADFSDEYIWEFNMDDADQANFVNEGDNRAVQTLNWRTENVTVPGGLTVQGYGGADLNKNFYDFMVARGEKGKPRYLGTIWDYEDIQNRFIELGLATTKAGAISEFWNTVPVMSNCQGYFRIKMVPWLDDLYNYDVVQTIHTKVNWPGMRYSELLLIYAEACKQSGSKNAEGLAALNQVRQRAGLPALASYVLQDIKDEKRAELAFENERYLDLIRWGDAPSVLANRGSFIYNFDGYIAGTTNYHVTVTPVQNATGFKAGRDELFPFPYNERLLNPNLAQNPGW